jgi:hypothetical protein
VIVGAADQGGDQVVATVRTARREHTIRWAMLGLRGANPDALVAAALQPAMVVGEALCVEGSVSSRLLSSVPTIQDVFESWAPSRFHPVTVVAPARPSNASDSSSGVAAFFTGGVDSFFTVLTHADELDALVFVHGFDIALEATAHRQRVAVALRAAADQLGLPLLEVETDVRAFSDDYVDWRDEYHGAALASVALLLAPTFRRVYIPASMTYASLAPLGSHPLVDPLWSTEDVELVHDGCEANRLDKLRILGRSTVAGEWLRVCAQSHTGAYNCGCCEKCLRTSVAIRALGLEDHFRSLPKLDREGIRDLRRRGVAGSGATWTHSLRALEASGSDPELARAVRAARRRRRRHELARPVVSRSRMLRARVRRFRRHG